MKDKIEELIQEAKGFYDKQQYQEALQHYLQVTERISENDERATDVLNMTGACYYLLGDYSHAAGYFEKYIDNINNKAEVDLSIRAVGYQNLAYSFSKALKKEQAVDYFKAALKDYTDSGLGKSEDAISLMNAIGNCWYYLKSYDRAEPVYLQTRQLSEEVLGKDNPHTNLHRYNLGQNYLKQGKLEQSFSEFKAAYDYYRGNESLFDLLELLNHLTSVCLSIQPDKKHEIYFSGLYEEAKRLYGDDNENTAITAKKLAKFYNSVKNYSDAIKYFEKAYKLQVALKGELDSATVNTQSYLAMAYYDNQQFAKARELFEFILEYEKKHQQEENKYLLAAYVNVAYAALNAGDNDAAEKNFEEAIRITKKIESTDSRELTNYESKLVNLYFQRKKYGKAAVILKETIRNMRKSGQEDSLAIADVYAIYAQVLKYISKKGPESELSFKKALEIYSNQLEQHDIKIIDLKIKFAGLYSDVLMNPDLAIVYLEEVLDSVDQKIPGDSSYVQNALMDLGDIYFNLKDHFSAIEKYSRVLEIITKSKREYPRRKTSLLKKMAMVELALKNRDRARNYLSEGYILSRKHFGLEHEKTVSYINLIKSGLGKKVASEVMGELKLPDEIEKYINSVTNELNISSGVRNIRVFISSTFRDMMEERDHLMRIVFPEIKKLCRKHGVEFTEVDLRWGVTEEEAEQGKVIEICLNEIDRSRPYFIGILGERYGWIPDSSMFSKIKSTLEKYSWVKEDIQNELSITEMEIQYGVLRNKAMKGNAFFYLRDEALSGKEAGSAEKEGALPHKKLKALKHTLRGQTEYPVRNYSSISRLGEMIGFDLKKSILRDTQLDREVSKQEQQRLLHINYLKNLVDSYFPLKKNTDQLSQLIDENNNKIVLFSPQGAGKSSLLAWWITENYKRTNPEPVFFHFVHADPNLKDVHQLLSRISSELNSSFLTRNEYVLNTPNPSDSFGKVLGDERINSRIFIIIDGVEEIRHLDFFKPLYWLPRTIPGHVYLIMSTNDRDYQQILIDQGYAGMTLAGFSLGEKENFIRGYLKKSGKKLVPQLVSKIANSKLSASPDRLKMVLDELKLFGQHENLETELQKYLSLENKKNIFQLILERLENDFDKSSPGLTANVLSFLVVSTFGLSEQELIELTGTARLYWSPVYHALDPYLIRSEGLIRVVDPAFASAIRDRYLSDSGRETKIKKQLSDYLCQTTHVDRKAGELTNLLYDLGDRKKLLSLITDKEVFGQIMKDARYEDFIKYKNFIGQEFDIIAQFKKNFSVRGLTDAELLELSGHLLKISQVLRVDFKWEDAMYFAQKAMDLRNEILGDDHPVTADAMIEIGGILKGKGEKEAAYQMYEKALPIIEKNPFKSGIKAGHIYSAMVDRLLDKDRLDEAWDYAIRLKKFLEKAMGADNAGVVEVYNKFCKIEMKRGNLDNAENYCKKALSILESAVGINSMIFQVPLFNLITIYEERGESEKVIRFILDSEKVLTEKLGKYNPIVYSLKFIAASKYFQKKDFKSSESKTSEVILNCIENKDFKGKYFSGSIELMTMIYKLTGREGQIEEFKEKIERIKKGGN